MRLPTNRDPAPTRLRRSTNGRVATAAEGEAAAEGVVEGDTDTRVAAGSPGSRLTALPAGEIRQIHKGHDDQNLASQPRASTEGGIVRPKAFAVLRLTKNSNAVGCSRQPHGETGGGYVHGLPYGEDRVAN